MPRDLIEAFLNFSAADRREDAIRFCTWNSGAR
jgi:hypothetical protein